MSALLRWVVSELRHHHDLAKHVAAHHGALTQLARLYGLMRTYMCSRALGTCATQRWESPRPSKISDEIRHRVHP